MVGSFNIYGSRKLVLSASDWFFQYIREPEFGSFNIYGSRRLVLSLFTEAGDWSFQYI